MNMNGPRLVLWLCAFAFILLSVRFFRGRRYIHAAVDLLLALGLIGVIYARF